MASVVAIGPGSVPAGSPVLDLTGLADGTEANGLTVAGVLFGYSLGNGHVIIDGGPGVTNNVNPPNIVSTGNPTGVLSVTLPSLASTFGYGYAVLNTSPVGNATIINLFNGATLVGTLLITEYQTLPSPVALPGFPARSLSTGSI